MRHPAHIVRGWFAYPGSKGQCGAVSEASQAAAGFQEISLSPKAGPSYAINIDGTFLKKYLVFRYTILK